MSDEPRGSTTFDFGDSRVRGNVFEDIGSDADGFVDARDAEVDNRWSGVDHTPRRTVARGIRWDIVTAVGTVALVVIGLVTLALAEPWI